jgi:hypothetical protein
MFDNTPPSGCYASSPTISSTLDFAVTWSEGTDVGSDLSGLYDVRYMDSSSGVWTDWLMLTPQLGATFSGQQEHVYFFEARTSDLVGNQEPFAGSPESRTLVDTLFTGPPPCSYVVGDINSNGAANGIDVTYGVSYLKGGNAPPDSCECAPLAFPFYAAMDVNGNCQANGIDITYYVAYLKGSPNPLGYCPDCPPVSAIAGGLPGSRGTR